MKKTLLLTAGLILFSIVVRAQEKEIPPPPPPPPPKVILSRYDPPVNELQAFYKQNPTVKRLFWKSEEDIVVVHKDKTMFVYNMKNEKEKAAFKEKYGNMTISEPPPPPPPPPSKSARVN